MCFSYEVIGITFLYNTLPQYFIFMNKSLELILKFNLAFLFSSVCNKNPNIQNASAKILVIILCTLIKQVTSPNSAALHECNSYYCSYPDLS